MALLKGVKDQIDIKVTANVDGDLGRTIPVSFIITVRKPKQSERKEIIPQIRDGQIDDETVIKTYLVGWRDLVGADGAQVPFNDETLAEVMDAPEYLRAVIQGIVTAIQGKELMAKNS